MTFKNKRVLVVDDEPISLKVLVSHIQQAGFEVVQCDSGEQALAHLEKDADFAAIVLDRLMPGLDGLAVFEKLQADPALATIPVIMLTAMDDSDAIIEAVSAGVFDYLTKPVDSEQLINLIKQTCI